MRGRIAVAACCVAAPIELDGESHEASFSLTRIASEATASGYELQIIGQSSLFDAQRATGAVTIEDLIVSLPTTKPRKKSSGGGGSRCGVLVRGTRTSDQLNGTGASERLKGGYGDDRIKGRGGDDCISGGPGRDRIAAGSGDDTALVGAKDRVRRCETVKRR